MITRGTENVGEESAFSFPNAALIKLRKYSKRVWVVRALDPLILRLFIMQCPCRGRVFTPVISSWLEHQALGAERFS